MIVVIDGPAGSGKSSTAKAVARSLSIQYLDSGALYRAATLIYLRSNRQNDLFFDRLKKSNISFHYQDDSFHVYLDDEEVSQSIRSMEVAGNVSEVASMKNVRAYVNQKMREAVRQDLYIADGRDLGTAVFPDAALKFYMVADIETRARRRYEELAESGKPAELNDIIENISARDKQDAARSEDPMRKPDDAIEINTTNLSFDEQVQFISNKVRSLISSN